LSCGRCRSRISSFIFNSTELGRVNVELEITSPPRQKLNVLARQRCSPHSPWCGRMCGLW
jgi:hypothetical protein